jgi:hypothetical protein
MKLFWFYYNQVKKENELLKQKMIEILESKQNMSIDEYELYVYLCKQPIEKIKKIYPKLPESEEE